MILSAIAALAPTIAGLLFGDKGEEVANTAVSVAKQITGETDDVSAIEALKANPEQLVQWQEVMNNYALEIHKDETKRLHEVNETMRAEIAGKGTFKTCWRPAFGWVMAFSWGVVIIGFMALLGYTVVTNPSDLVGIISAIGSVVQAMVPMWFIAMSVLGVAVYKRSSDKKVASGDSTSSLTGAISGIKNLISGGKS